MTKCSVCQSEFSVVLHTIDMNPAWYYLKCMRCGACGAGSKKKSDAEQSVLTKKVQP